MTIGELIKLLKEYDTLKEAYQMKNNVIRTIHLANNNLDSSLELNQILSRIKEIEKIKLYVLPENIRTIAALHTPLG